MNHVDAYWEYHKIVGDEVGDKLLTPQQYEEFKKKVTKDLESLRTISSRLTTDLYATKKDG